MAWQLIYTSAPRGLLSGQSGFCTVARSRELREALAQRLEQISSYHYLSVADAATARRNPTVSAFRILDLRGTKYHVLTRIQPAGLDFTARTNHIAHHLIFQGNELAQLPSPAAILRHWPGWLACWQGEPRLVEDPALDTFAVSKSFLPANTWLRATGDAGRAAGLLESEYTRGCYLLCPPGSEQQVLEMYCETLQLLNLHGQYALRPWRHPFTTFLQGEDNPGDFHWRACQEGTPACQDALQKSISLVPLQSVRVPLNSLVKSARDGAKPLPGPSSAPAPNLKRPTNEPVKLEAPEPARSAPQTWEEPTTKRKKSDFLDINLSVDSAGLARIGVFVAVLAVLLGLKFFVFKKRPVPPAIPPAAIATPEHPGSLTSQTSPPTEISPPLSTLNWLPADEPTYVLVLSSPQSFDLPLASITRFANLLHRYDRLDLKPAEIQMAAGMNNWNFAGGPALTVASRQGEALGCSGDGLQCSFDYAGWQTLAVHTSLTIPPAALTLRFAFSNTEAGEPFRLLIVNQSNPPPPIHLGKAWVRANGDSLVSSLASPLGQRLQAEFIPLAAWHWQLEPFVRDQKGSQTNWLYKNWPLEDLPEAGGELDFTNVKTHLATQLKSHETEAATLDAKIRHRIDQASFDTPLAADLKITKPELASFSTFAPDPTPDDFLQYLNGLKRAAKAKNPPHFDDNEDEASLAAKFQQWHDWWIDRHPDSKGKLTVGDTNYFAIVWQNLKSIEKIRLEKRAVAAKIQRVRAEMKEAPGSLDRTAYVSLYLTEGTRPGLEVIRFDEP